MEAVYQIEKKNLAGSIKSTLKEKYKKIIDDTQLRVNREVKAIIE